eukprot:TRINITY_DN96125_c0_g1_i1.p1 TRINITY_DN96125_c0_g1~~TRINITY_DN96125_c0_g1_i1.p1  ORF type:complete len:271 (+),score=55.12 TRINITY_DN96125_c0_g1_i1:43-855(+)
MASSSSASCTPAYTRKNVEDAGDASSGAGCSASSSGPTSAASAIAAGTTSSPGPSAAATATGKQALVNDSTVRRFVLDAISDGVPKTVAKKWVTELSRNFYVKDDASFTRAWCELRDAWERKNSKRRRKQQRQSRQCPRDAQDQDEPELPLPKKPCSEKEKEPPSGWQEEVTAAASSARKDVAEGLCSCYQQALAVRLTLSLGLSAARALSALMSEPISDNPSSLIARIRCFEGATMPLKQLALLIHPDKSSHPCAKEAFQKLAPALRLN